MQSLKSHLFFFTTTGTKRRAMKLSNDPLMLCIRYVSESLGLSKATSSCGSRDVGVLEWNEKDIHFLCDDDTRLRRDLDPVFSLKRQWLTPIHGEKEIKNGNTRNTTRRLTQSRSNSLVYSFSAF